MTNPTFQQKLEEIVYHMYESSGNSKWVKAGRKPLNPDEAQAQITQLVEELLGEDEIVNVKPKPNSNLMVAATAFDNNRYVRNEFRAEIRTNLKEGIKNGASNL